MRTLFTFFLIVFFLGASPARADEQILYVGPPNISLPVIVAIEKGYFKESGLTVKYEPIQTGKLAMEALLSDRADLGSVVLTNIAYSGFQSDQLKIIASNGPSLDDAIIFPTAGSIQTPDDLKGKRIGFVFSTSSHDFLRRVLAVHGLGWRDIHPVSLQPPTLAIALKGGQVDAVATWQPWRSQIKDSLDGHVKEFNNTIDLYPRHTFMATSEKTRNRLGPRLPAFLSAVIKAEKFINDHPEETAEILAKVVRLEPSVTETFWMKIDIGLDPEMIGLVESYASWVIDNQDDFQDKTLPDFRKNFAPVYLKNAAPERVTGEWRE